MRQNVVAADQFGKASGRGGALRDALGGFNKETGKWQRRKPNVHALEATREPHGRGAILVAAVFDAFLKVYRARTLDLYRIASEGTGVLRAGDIHPDLSNRLAGEAARCAQFILQMCIRAIDYCPPVGITFGDYLRALVTSDYEFNPDDTYGYRLAVVESFRQWGIHPKGMRSMSIEALLWPTGTAAMEEVGVKMGPEQIRSLFLQRQNVGNLEQVNRRRAKSLTLRPWNLESDRYETWEGVDDNSAVLWAWLMSRGRTLIPALGLVVDEPAPPTVYRSRSTTQPAVEVHSVRTALRRSARGATVTDLVVEITQRRRGYFDAGKQKREDANGVDPVTGGDFLYRAGCTLLIDPVTMGVRRVIRTAGTVNDDAQLGRVRRFLTEGGLQPDNAFWLARDAIHALEPFALLHQYSEGYKR
jgi:hypothetical protein